MPGPWRPATGTANSGVLLDFNLRREARPLATTAIFRVPDDWKNFNLRREARPLATSGLDTNNESGC